MENSNAVIRNRNAITREIEEIAKAKVKTGNLVPLENRSFNLVCH